MFFTLVLLEVQRLKRRKRSAFMALERNALTV
jgi:hypothetical protein